jgi:hypothetical protein
VNSSPIDNSGAPARGPRGPVRRGMTLFEIMFAVLIIFLVMGLLIGAIRIVSGSAQDVSHRTAVLSLGQGVSQFQTEFGFPPPLVRDVVTNIGPGNPPTFATTGDPVETQSGQLVIRTFSAGQHANFLRHRPLNWPPAQGDADLRFSIYSIPYYLIGVLDQPRVVGATDSAPLDGFQGPGFRKPRSDGQFEVSGRRFDPFFSVGSGSTTLLETDAAAGRIELRDRSGIAFRYYRWERGQGNPPSLPASPNAAQLDAYRAWFAVPRMVGDPLENESLRNASFAIVGAGPDGLFGDEAALPNEHPQRLQWTDMARKLSMTISGNNPSDEEKLRIIARAMEDNIVEVGR